MNEWMNGVLLDIHYVVNSLPSHFRDTATSSLNKQYLRTQFVPHSKHTAPAQHRPTSE